MWMFARPKVFFSCSQKDSFRFWRENSNWQRCRVCYAACQILCNSDGSQEKKKEKKNFLLYACVPVSVCIVRLSLKKKKTTVWTISSLFPHSVFTSFFVFFFTLRNLIKQRVIIENAIFLFITLVSCVLIFKKSSFPSKKEKKYSKTHIESFIFVLATLFSFWLVFYFMK